MDNTYLSSLKLEELRGLSERLLADLKEARERLNQGPSNSSRPPSSRAPWERGAAMASSEEEELEKKVSKETAKENLNKTLPVETKPSTKALPENRESSLAHRG